MHPRTISAERGSQGHLSMVEDFPRSVHPVKLHMALGVPRCILGATESTQAGGSQGKQRGCVLDVGCRVPNLQV